MTKFAFSASRATQFATNAPSGGQYLQTMDEASYCGNIFNLQMAGGQIFNQFKWSPMMLKFINLGLMQVEPGDVVNFWVRCAMF